MTTARHTVPATRPTSDVSATVGLLGLGGLLVWILICRSWPDIAEALALPGPRERMSGPLASLTGLVMAALPMVIYSIFVEKVHLRASTGLDWAAARTARINGNRVAVKLIGLWTTFGAIALLYWFGRWYWNGTYQFSLVVLAACVLPLVVFSMPYVAWLDRAMVQPRDASWHFGAMLLRVPGWEKDQVLKHVRAWTIKGFFTAFMLSIVPLGFADVVNANFSAIVGDPVRLGVMLFELLFVIDVQIGTVGYILTMRPLDAHIRSGNPFLAGWLAAFICYPPFVWGIIGNGLVLNYENNTADWGYWLSGNDAVLWIWMAWLVFLTACYAWATVVFGIRFSNLTYRGVITHGPYRWTRHPAYVSKNLFWWGTVMPFLVTSGSTSDAVRNTLCLLAVNAIYFWRAKTEEAHLLAEDAKYRDYHAWMAQNGVITAPLVRLQRRLAARWKPDPTDEAAVAAANAPSQSSGAPSSVS